MKPGEKWRIKSEDIPAVTPVIIDSVKNDNVYFWHITSDGTYTGTLYSGKRNPFWRHRVNFLKDYEKVWE